MLHWLIWQEGALQSRCAEEQQQQSWGAPTDENKQSGWRQCNHNSS